MTGSAPPSWLGLCWKPWQQMGQDGLSVPEEPGLYCFRTLLSNWEAEDRCVIAYIGETDNLCRRICRDWGATQEEPVDPMDIPVDANNTKTKIKFFSRWRDYPSQFEVSFCTNSMTPHHNLADEQHRQAAEALAMWRCRVETCRSAVANHQRTTYAMGGNGVRDRGHWRDDILPSMPPRKQDTFPTDPRWMSLVWTRFAFLRELKPSSSPRPDQEMHDASLDRPALYKIVDPHTLSLLKVGFRNPIGSGLRSEIKDLRPAVNQGPVASWAHLPPGIPRYCNIEVRDDLIGAYYFQSGEPPEYQFRKVGGSSDSQTKELN